MNMMGQTISKNTVHINIPIKCETQQKSVTLSFTGTNFLIMINFFIFINPQKLSVIHIFLNENETFRHNCLLKVTNLVKF